MSTGFKHSTKKGYNKFLEVSKNSRVINYIVMTYNYLAKIFSSN